MKRAITRQLFLRNTLMARLAICLLAGAVSFAGILGTIGLIGKIINDGWAEGFAGMMRSIAALTFKECTRLIGLSIALSLIACFPVYLTRMAPSLTPLLFCAALGSLVLAGYLSLERWYSFGGLDFPPPQLVAVTAMIGFAASVISRAIVLRLESIGSKR
jgi:hypothetical protein